jgi:methyltransferase OMS1
MRRALLLGAAAAGATRPTVTRRAALGACAAPLVPTAARAAYDPATYDRYAKSYDELDGGRAAAALGIAAARRDMAARCAGRVLEVGAGTGLQAPFYASNSDIKGVTFVDASRGMLDALRSKLEAVPLPFPAAAVEADAARLPVASGAYDTAVDTFGLCVYDDPVAVLRELGRAVGPNGRVLLLENARPRNALLGAYVDATAGAVARYGGKGCRYDQDVEGLARAAGLRVLRSEAFGGGFFRSLELVPSPAPGQ